VLQGELLNRLLDEEVDEEGDEEVIAVEMDIKIMMNNVIWEYIMVILHIIYLICLDFIVLLIVK
jgi:hypothetical protein